MHQIWFLNSVVMIFSTEDKLYCGGTFYFQIFCYRSDQNPMKTLISTIWSSNRIYRYAYCSWLLFSPKLLNYKHLSADFSLSCLWKYVYGLPICAAFFKCWFTFVQLMEILMVKGVLESHWPDARWHVCVHP